MASNDPDPNALVPACPPVTEHGVTCSRRSGGRAGERRARSGCGAAVRWNDQRGLGLAEVLIAIGIITTALLGFAGGLALQSSSGITGGIELGQAAISRGRYVSSATFLAQDRLEQIKRLQYVFGPPLVDQIGAGAPPAALPDEDYGTIPGYQDFRREVTVQDGVPSASMKLITVTVRFRRFAQDGLRQEAILLRTTMAARP